MTLQTIFDKPENREQIIKYMKDIEKTHREEITDKVMNILNEPEKIVHTFIHNLGFQEGAWYRPIHNDIVTASGVAICEKENFPRHIIYACQLHDSGNSAMKVAPTIQGTDWENPDKRIEHGKISQYISRGSLGILKLLGKIDIKDKSLNALYQAMVKHDFPYVREELLERKVIGKLDEQILKTPEEIALRSADRTFVPSALSWYKDLIAHYGEAKYHKHAKDLGIEINPLDFLLCRIAFFYLNSDTLPKKWDKKDFPLKTELASYNEGGFCEPCYTKTEQQIIDFIFNKRAREIFEVLELKTPEKFAEFFEKTFLHETCSIINFADKNKNYSLS